MTPGDFEWVLAFYRQMAGTAKGRVGRDEVRRKENESKESQPFDKGRDPVSAAASIDQLLGDFRWGNHLAKASLFAEWEAVVGKETAVASQPESLNNGTLLVRCSSTAWATQLNIISERYLNVIRSKYPDLDVVALRFQGPAAPSWKKGSKSVSGRGPRDTYG